jgi:hypothetical protein
MVESDTGIVSGVQSGPPEGNSDRVQNELAARPNLVPERTWVRAHKEDSWHIVDVAVNVENKWMVKTVCGLNLTDTTDPLNKRPSRDKTCENCFRFEEVS